MLQSPSLDYSIAKTPHPTIHYCIALVLGDVSPIVLSGPALSLRAHLQSGAHCSSLNTTLFTLFSSLEISATARSIVRDLSILDALLGLPSRMALAVIVCLSRPYGHFRSRVGLVKCSFPFSRSEGEPESLL